MMPQSNNIPNNPLKQNAIFIIITALLIGLFFLKPSLIYDRTLISSGEIWRLFTGNFVHSNLTHLALNLTGWIVAYLLFRENYHNKKLILDIIILSMTVGLGLWLFTPELIRYMGFSGVLYGLYLTGAYQLYSHNEKLIGLLVGTLIIGKLIWDFVFETTQNSADLIGVAVASQSHYIGIVAAIILILFQILTNRK